MSGGSFQYLFGWDVGEVLFFDQETLVKMRQALTEYPDSARAIEDLDLLLATRKFAHEAVEELMTRLAGVFKAVEWHRSGDDGAEDVAAALAKHAALSPRPDAASVQPVTTKCGRCGCIRPNGAFPCPHEGCDEGTA